ncbi:NmrA/HSCARG family protein [Acidisoma sp. C75]
MSYEKRPILVLGATGQQGGSVAAALLKAGWPVRALVRDPLSPKALALRDAGVAVLRGDLGNPEDVRAAMQGAHGVFSVQTSSPSGEISDEDEVRYGITVADMAVRSEIAHLVYSSGAGVGQVPTGVGHFDSKARIEAHIARLPITATVIRPVTFMELLMMPGLGLDEGRFTFFVGPDQSMQLLAVDDIGKFVAAIFSDRERFAGQTLEIASDSVTGREIEALFSEAAGRPIPYARFPDEVLLSNPLFGKLAALVDDGRLAGKADLAALHRINPEILSFRSWLAGPGRKAFDQALSPADAGEDKEG